MPRVHPALPPGAVALCLCLAAVPPPAAAQDAVTIEVDANVSLGLLPPIYNWFGYDEPNYTYGQFGPRLIHELAQLSPVPVYLRTHNLLVTGDGTPALKWGSTNAYTEDAAGRPVYDWRILDRIFDTYVAARTRPMVEIGFMPEALSTHPQPYRHTWPKGGITAGWAYPPKDYRKWGELVHQWARHAVERYGAAQVATWYWEVWNEPDISYWKGTAEEYDELYDYAVDGVRRALPEAKVGGPATTGPAAERAGAFLRQFLEHCARGKNHVTGKTGAPLDFVSFHAKGRPAVVDGRVRMGLSKELADVARGFEIVASFPEFRTLPVILSEADPEGCAACSARDHPENAYRNGALYACYTAAAWDGMLKLAARDHINVAGMLTWAFEFEGQPYFDGLRTLATNGVDKPVLNVFRMLGLMPAERVKTASTAAIPLDEILRAGVRGEPDVDAAASRGARRIAVLAWHYHDDDAPGPEKRVEVKVRGIPLSARRVLLRHYRIDTRHSNAYTAWKEMGAPQTPSAEQQARLEAAGRLELPDSPQWLWNDAGRVEVGFRLPRQAVSLVELSW